MILLIGVSFGYANFYECGRPTCMWYTTTKNSLIQIDAIIIAVWLIVSFFIIWPEDDK